MELSLSSSLLLCLLPLVVYLFYLQTQQRHEPFRPERWLDEAGAFRPENPYKYPVFNAGPRSCLGKETAYIQMKSIVACVYERFTLRYVGGEGHPGLNLSGTLHMAGGLPMKITPRDQSA